MNKLILKKFPSLLAILVVAGGVQTFTSCSSDDDGGGDTPSSSSVGTQGGGSSSSVAAQGGSSSSPVPSCGEYDHETQYCSNGNIKDYEFVPYEGQTYKTVVIGEQVWFAENLNYEVEGSKCCENLDSNCDIYGRLYNWAMAMDFDEICNTTACAGQVNAPHQGICPDGWHIPSKEEWNTLSSYVESNSGCSGCDASRLKAARGWTPYRDIKNLDTYGFSALPGGLNHPNDYNSFVRNSGYWWTTDEDLSNHTYYREMSYGNDFVITWSSSYYKSILLSIRCVKD